MQKRQDDNVCALKEARSAARRGALQQAGRESWYSEGRYSPYLVITSSSRQPAPR